MRTHEADELVKCPICEGEQEETAAEHCVPNNPTKPIRYDCQHCGEVFSVCQIADGTYKVEEE